MCGCKMVLLFVVLVVCVLDTVVCEDSSDEARELIEQGKEIRVFLKIIVPETHFRKNGQRATITLC